MTLNVKARKLVVDSAGVETEVSAAIDPNRLLIEVGGTADNTTTVKTSSFAVSISAPAEKRHLIRISRAAHETVRTFRRASVTFRGGTVH